MAKSGTKILKTLLFLALILPTPALSQEESSIPLGTGLPTPAAFANFGQKKATETPVMIIRFNQKNVYFQTPIRRIVGKIDETKPSAKYELLSKIPEGKNRNPGNDKDFNENVNNVIAVLNRFQVPIENISVRKETSSTIENQEIHIFVQ